MRYAIVADLHGQRAKLAAVLAAAGADGVDQVIVAGDYLECHVSKRELASARPRTLRDVLDVDPAMWRMLRERAVLVRGNQEERIAQLVAGLPDVDGLDDLRPLLAAPLVRELGHVTIIHGHTFDWSRLRDRWVPTLDEDLPDARVVVFGHSHEPLVTTLARDGAGWRYDDSFHDPDRVLDITGATRYLVNLAPSRTSPLWLHYDDGNGTMRWRTT